MTFECERCNMSGNDIMYEKCQTKTKLKLSG